MKKKVFLFPTLLTSSFLFASMIIGGVSSKVSYGATRLEARNEGDVVEAVAKYTFSDAENIGFDSATRDGTNKYGMTPYEEGDNNDLVVTDGVVTFNGENALAYTPKGNDPTAAYQNSDITMCWSMSVPAAADRGTGWASPLCMRFESWESYGMFLFSENSNMLRYVATGAESDFWGPEIVDMQAGVVYNFVMSMDKDGLTNIYVNGNPTAKYGKTTYTSGLNSDWAGLTFGGVFNHNGADGAHTCVGKNASFTTIPGMTVSNIQFYDFAFDGIQANLYNSRGFLYKTDLGEQKVTTPIAHYEFKDAEQPGKDSMGKYNLDVFGDGVSAADGVATFTGQGGLVSPSSNDLLEVIAGNPFTVKATITATTTDTTPIGMYASNWASGKGTAITTWGNNLRVSLNDGAARIGNDACWGDLLDSSASTEHTVVMSVEPGAKANMYCDGVLKQSCNVDAAFTVAGGDCHFTLGGSNWGGGWGFLQVGTLKDVRVYNFAANTAEVNALYQVGNIYENAAIDVASVDELDFSETIIVPDNATDAEIIGAYAPVGKHDITVKMTDGSTKTAKVEWDAVERREAGIYLKGTLSEIANKDNVCAYAKIGTISNVVEILPLAKYNFESVETIGKDAMGHFDLEVSPRKVKVGEGEDATYQDADYTVAVEDGGVKFDGKYALVTPEDNNIGKYLSTDTTISLDIKLTDVPTSSDGWDNIMGFGQNGYEGATSWDKLQISAGSTMLRYTACSGIEDSSQPSNVDGRTYGPYWGYEVGDLKTGEFHNFTIVTGGEDNKMSIYFDSQLKVSYNLPEDYRRNILASRFALGCCFGYEQWADNCIIKNLAFYDFAADATQVRVINGAKKLTSNVVEAPYVISYEEGVTYSGETIWKSDVTVSTPVEDKIEALRTSKVTANLSDSTTAQLPVSWTNVVEEGGKWYAIGTVGLGKQHLLYSVAAPVEVKVEVTVAADPVVESSEPVSSETPVSSEIPASSDAPIESSQVPASSDAPTSSEEPVTPVTKGCGGSIVACGLISMVAAAGIVLIKSKKED